MTCGPVTGQCLEPLPDGTDEAPVCCDPFALLFDFAEVSTAQRHLGCFVGIRNQGEAAPGEIRDGRWCGWGCAGSENDTATCDDGALLSMADPRDGLRWLRPHPTRPAQDAHGVLHDLPSNRHHLVSRETHYQRGSCWQNDGLECFGTDVCACYNKTREFEVNPGEGCGPNQQTGPFAGEPLEGILPDASYRGGWRWPPVNRQGSATNSQAKGWYCRRFNDTRRGADPITAVSLTAAGVGGVPGAMDPVLEPILAGTSNCLGTALVPCFGQIERPANPDCETAVWYDRQGFYNSGTSRDRFDSLVVRNNDAGIGVCDSGTEGAEAQAKFKDRVLRFVGTDPFPDRRFGRLEHLAAGAAGNSGLGHFRTSWSGVEGIEVPGVFGQGRLHQTGCPVDLECRITAVDMFALLVLAPTRQTIMERDRLNIAADPYCRVQIVVQLRIRASLRGACTLTESWRPEGDPRRERPISLDGLDVADGLDSIEFVDPEGRSFVPVQNVEWRGFLGGHSTPSTPDLRRNYANCTELADAFASFQVSGWPVLLDTRPENPLHWYSGSMTLGFR
jgi:hypothetical protein